MTSVAQTYFNPVVYVTEDVYLESSNVMRLVEIVFRRQSCRCRSFSHRRLVEGDSIGYMLRYWLVPHVFIGFSWPIQSIDLISDYLYQR